MPAELYRIKPEMKKRIGEAAGYVAFKQTDVNRFLQANVQATKCWKPEPVPNLHMKKQLCALLLVALAPFAPVAKAVDPLPSWNGTAPRQAIVAFVDKVTREGSPDFVPVPERIATFDNDGTLWCEQPMYFQSIDDQAGKPVGINAHIGRRPIAAFGNSDGDRQMLEWTQAGAGPRLLLLVHHDDAKREFEYGAKSHIGTFSDSLMEEANKSGWTVISMKEDWRTVFAFGNE